MLWRVGSTNLHIFGSVHAMDAPPRIAANALRVIDAAEVVAFEQDLTAPVDLSMGHYADPSESLKSDLSPTLWLATEAAWDAAGHPSNELASKRPWLAALQLQGPLAEGQGISFAHSVDHALSARCDQQRKKRAALELPGTALHAFADAPKAEQVLMLGKIVLEPSKALTGTKAMIRAWKDENPNGCIPVLLEGHAEAPTMFSALFEARNHAWIPKLLEMIATGRPAVAVVGIGHMVGPENLEELLAAEGHRCTRA